VRKGEGNGECKMRCLQVNMCGEVCEVKCVRVSVRK
jgi:hypothetical protein